MNCNSGDLAMIVRNTHDLTCVSALIGTPIKVTHLIAENLEGFGPVWAFAGKPLRCPNCGGLMGGMLDADLQPLRPPAASVDFETRAPTAKELEAEMLDWLGVGS